MRPGCRSTAAAVSMSRIAIQLRPVWLCTRSDGDRRSESRPSTASEGSGRRAREVVTKDGEPRRGDRAGRRCSSRTSRYWLKSHSRKNCAARVEADEIKSLDAKAGQAERPDPPDRRRQPPSTRLTGSGSSGSAQQQIVGREGADRHESRRCRAKPGRHSPSGG